jgi:hypothetical protein
MTQWHRVARYADDLLSSPDAADRPLVVSSVARMLAATALAVFPNNALTEPAIEGRRDAHSATARRAVAFIDDHAQADITAADIAAAAGVTIRAVQLAFRRHLDTTPARYLRRAVARRYPGVTVAQHAVNVHLLIDYLSVAAGIAVWLLLVWVLVRGRDRARIAVAAYFGAMSLALLLALGQGSAAM